MTRFSWLIVSCVTACAHSEASAPNLIELTGEQGEKATITARGFTFTGGGGGSELEYAGGNLTMTDATNKLSLGHGRVRIERRCGKAACDSRSIVIDLDANTIVLSDGTGRTSTLGLDVLELDDPKAGSIKARVALIDGDHPVASLELTSPKKELPKNPEGIAREKLANGAVRLTAGHNYSVVSAATVMPYPDESVSASLGSAPKGAGLRMSRIGQEKHISIGD